MAETNNNKLTVHQEIVNNDDAIKARHQYSAFKKPHPCMTQRLMWIAWIVVMASAAGLIFGVLYGRNYAHDSIAVRVVDLVNNSMDTKYKIKFQNTDANLYTVLEAYQQQSDEFKFSVTRFNASVMKINAVNGLKASKTTAGVWVVGKRSGHQSCISVRPNIYIPHYDDTIILAYVTADMAHNLFSCFDSNVKSIKISITNYVSDIAFTNVYYGAAIESNGTLIEVMDKLQKKNKNFWFETVEYSDLGKMITLINGLEQDAEKSTYWALGKEIEDKLCLLSVGGSSYYPKVDEHIVFAYITYDMFNNFKSCDGGSTHDSINVQISVQNMISNVKFINNSFNMASKTNTSLINIMKEFNKTNNNFRFTTVEYDGLGDMITSINGLEQNSTIETYWALGRVMEGRMCLLSVGASSYFPHPDEHIIFWYITYDMFNNFESCDGGSTHDSISVKVSVQNTIGNVDFVNASYNMESKMNTSLINIMKELNNTDRNFRFTTVAYTGLGEMITSINGLEQNSTMKTYWSIGKMAEGEICLLSVGISSYYPEDENEHIIFLYITYDMFNEFPSCDKGNDHAESHIVSDGIVIGVQNLAEDVSMKNASYAMESTLNGTTMLELLKQLNNTNSNFSFTTQTLSQDFRTVITSVNGFWQNSEYFWAPGKTVNGGECLISEGIDVFTPSQGDYILLMYSDADTLGGLPYCQVTS